MYEVKDPRFVIKIGFDRKLLLDEKPDLGVFRTHLAEAFHARFRGIKFNVKFVHVIPEVYYFIYFPNTPHKTVIKKMLDWIKRNYVIESLDISGV